MIRTYNDSFIAKTQELLNPVINSTCCTSIIVDECILLVMRNLKFMDLQNLKPTCNRFHLLSHKAPMWFTLHAQMIRLMGLEQLKLMPQLSFLTTPKDILCNALTELKPEALLTKCFFYYDNIFIPRDYALAMKQILLIKKNETIISSKLKIKIDLQHAELLILRSEFGIEGDEKDNDEAQDLLENILKSDFVLAEDKAWATCLIGLLFYYTKDDLFLNGDVLTDHEISLQLQTVINDEFALLPHKAIANLYQDLLDSRQFENDDQSQNDEYVFEEADRYEQLSYTNENSLLPLPYKAKCALQIALMDYYDDVSEGSEIENDRIFAAFNQVIQDDFAFPSDKNIAMLHQAIMRYRGLVKTLTDEEAEQLLDQIIKDKATDSKSRSTARMYKASMNLVNQVYSMADNELFETFNKFVLENSSAEPEDIALAKLNMGLMLIGKRLGHISFEEAKVMAFNLFTEVSRAHIPIQEYKIQAEYQLSLFLPPTPSNP